MIRRLSVLAVMLSSAFLPLRASDRGSPGEFDYGVLALIWSPEHSRSKLAA